MGIELLESRGRKESEKKVPPKKKSTSRTAHLSRANTCTSNTVEKKGWRGGRGV